MRSVFVSETKAMILAFVLSFSSEGIAKVSVKGLPSSRDTFASSLLRTLWWRKEGFFPLAVCWGAMTSSTSQRVSW